MTDVTNYDPEAEDEARAAAAEARCAEVKREKIRVETLRWIAHEAGQYADGAEDAHYLAKFLLEVEQRARDALKEKP